MTTSIRHASAYRYTPYVPSLARPRLLADIGGTNARFALEMPSGLIEAVAVLSCRDYPHLADAMHAYLDRPDVVALGGGAIRAAGIAIANPVEGDEIRMTNHHWKFSQSAIRREFDFEHLVLVNDFKALAMALPFLTIDQKRQVGGGLPRGGVLGLVGAGTGLGVSGLLCAGGQWVALDSEGGHVSFAPFNEKEAAILQFAWREHRHVSAERLMSGIGLETVYRACAELAALPPLALSVPDIVGRGLTGACPVCVETIESFCEMLGTVASNLALTLGAKAGIYIGGGIVPRLGERFAQSGFRQRFEQKGRFSDYLKQIPTYVIAADYPAFIGVAALLRQ